MAEYHFRRSLQARTGARDKEETMKILLILVIIPAALLRQAFALGPHVQAPRRTALLASQDGPVPRCPHGAREGPLRAGRQPGARAPRRSTSAAACCAATWAWRWPRWARRARRWRAWARPSPPTRPTRWPSSSARACCSAWSASRTRWPSWRRCGCAALYLPFIYPIHAIHLPYVYPIPARRGLAAQTGREGQIGAQSLAKRRVRTCGRRAVAQSLILVIDGKEAAPDAPRCRAPSRACTRSAKWMLCTRLGRSP